MKMNLQLSGLFPYITFAKTLGVFLFVFILSPTILKAEISEIIHQTGTISTLEDIYQLEVRTINTNNQTYALKLTLTQNSKIKFRGQTGQFIPSTNINFLNYHMLSPIAIEIPNKETLSGEYLLRVEVVNSLNQIVLVDQLRLSSQNNNTEENKTKKQSPIQFSGSASLYGQYSDVQGVNTFVPRNYVRAEVHPDIAIGGIPFGVDLLYSTEQSAFRQSINQAVFRFDPNTFRRQLSQKVQSKIPILSKSLDIEGLSNLNSLKEKFLQKKFPDFNKWKDQLADIDIEKYEQDLKQLQSLEQILASPQIEEKINRLSELVVKPKLSETEKAEVEQLKAFKKEILKLQAKEKEIKALAASYEKVADTYQKYKKAKQFADSKLIRDPSFLKQGIKKLDVISKGEKFLNGIDALSIGTTYPYYSRLSLSSLNLNGVHVELNPGPIYLAASVGQSARFTRDSINLFKPNITLAQNTIAAKVGLGSRHDSHLHFVYLDIKDKDESIDSNDIRPESNRIIGTDAKLSLFQNRLNIGGEFMTSLFTRDMEVEMTDGAEFRFQNLPVNNLLGEANNTSSFDIAWRAFGEFDLFNRNTKVRASIEEVGPNYFSLGAPNLINDIFRWKAEFRQSFLKNRVHLSAFARKDENNLDPLLTSSFTSTTSYGISGQIVLKNGTSVNGSYSPYAQDNNIGSTSEEFNSDATMLNISLGIPMKLGDSFNSHTMLTYLSHNLVSNIPGIDYDLKMYGISQNISFGSFSLNGNVNYTPNQIIADQNQEVLTVNASGNLLLFKSWQNTFGYQYLGITNQESRSGFYYTSTFPITKFADFEIRAQQNIYDFVLDAQNNNMDMVIWGGLRIRW